MSLPAVYRRKVGRDLAGAVGWYEDQRAGLGEEFLGAVEASFDAIQDFPEMFARVHGEVRRAVVSRFPYAVFYRIEPKRVVVLAVLHMARDPKLWPQPSEALTRQSKGALNSVAVQFPRRFALQRPLIAGVERHVSATVVLYKMSRIITKAIVLVWAISGSAHALAETSAKLPLLGQLWFVDSVTAKPWEAVFRSGLRDLGYVDGKNIKIVARYADGDSSRFPTLLNELIALRPDVLFVSSKAVRAALAATKTIPLVSYSMGSAVQEGLVASLAHPGGNLTGMYSLGTETSGKAIGIGYGDHAEPEAGRGNL